MYDVLILLFHSFPAELDPDAKPDRRVDLVDGGSGAGDERPVTPTIQIQGRVRFDSELVRRAHLASLGEGSFDG